MICRCAIEQMVNDFLIDLTTPTDDATRIATVRRHIVVPKCFVYSTDGTGVRHRVKQAPVFVLFADERP